MPGLVMTERALTRRCENRPDCTSIIHKVMLRLLAAFLLGLSVLVVSADAGGDDQDPPNAAQSEAPILLKPAKEAPRLQPTPRPGDSSTDRPVTESDKARKPLLIPETPSNTGETQQTSLDRTALATESGFESLLKGNGLKGWIVQDGRAEAWTRNGSMIQCSGPGGGWLRTEAAYSDFHVKFEFQLQPGGNTGFGVRSPATGNPSFDGLEIQLIDESSPKYTDLKPTQRTGSIYYQVAPEAEAKVLPAGEWNLCEVICLGDQLTVKINGENVNRVNLAKGPEDDSGKTWRLADRPPLGHLALQSHTTPVAFRNLRIKDLTTEVKGGVRFVDLEPGTGETVDQISTVTVHYAGQLGTGRRFADTRDLGDAVTVSMGEVIPGWKVGLQGMKAGGKRRLIVPPEQGYGEFGASNLIPPGATLVFEVEISQVER